LAGLPAISLPCGFVQRLPVGLQIIGNQFEEEKIFALAEAFEEINQGDGK
jgi:aspartyl-tRNA(Asn)/glutamyl-tRNA(Gln) amidotransferase subunit A